MVGFVLYSINGGRCIELLLHKSVVLTQLDLT